MRRPIVILTVLVMVLSFSAPATAATQTANLNVSATLVAACTVTATPVDFGATNGTDITFSHGDITVTCPAGIPYNIALDKGILNAGSVYRWMSNGNPAYGWAYNLFNDASLSTLWGDSDFENTFPWGSSLADTGTGAPQSHSVYGKLEANPDDPPGTYTDTVLVTVHY